MLEMDFSSVSQEATECVKKTQLKITKFDKENQRIFLSAHDGAHSFFISKPAGESSESWTVWSDEQLSIDILTTDMDRLNVSSNATVSEVLESLNTLLIKTPQVKESSKALQSDDNDEDEEDDEDDDDQYYMNDDDDAQDNEELEVVKEKEDDMEVASNFFNSTGSKTAVLRLVKDLKAIKNVSGDFGISGQPRGNNLFMWDVELSNIPASTRLGKDLIAYGHKYKEEPVIKLDVQFPSEYPFNPPFIRVLKPRFQFLTGHITIGGSICMQALTRSGWCPASDLESVLIQVRTEILSDPKASLDPHRANIVYSEEEAKMAFSRMVQKYGWG